MIEIFAYAATNIFNDGFNSALRITEVITVIIESQLKIHAVRRVNEHVKEIERRWLHSARKVKAAPKLKKMNGKKTLKEI